MHSVLVYLLTYARRRSSRLLLTMAGLALSSSAVSYAYGIAGGLNATATSLLNLVVGGATAWVIPPGGLSVHPQTAAILPRGDIDGVTVDAIRAAEPLLNWYAVKAGPVVIGGTPFVVYCDERIDPGSGVLLSDRAPALGTADKAPHELSINGRLLRVAGIRSDLPPQVILAPLDAASVFLGPRSGVSWLVSSDPRAGAWAGAIERRGIVEVRSTPVSSRSPNTRAIVVVTGSGRSRFDPFTFRTQFAALVVNGALASTFGWAARAVFALGLVLLLSSALMGVAERKDEIAWFTVNGYLPTLTLILLAESAVLGALSFAGGATVALTLLAARLPPGSHYESVIGAALGMGAAFAPIVVLLGTLVPAQAAASKTPAEVVRAAL